MPRIRGRSASASFALFALTAACATNHVSKQVDATVIRFVRDSVPLQRTADMVFFTVNVIIRNRGATPIEVGGCGPEAQREINGEWPTLWSPVCVSPQSSLIVPGDSVMGPLTVAWFIKPGIEPQLDPRVTAGTYRLRYGVSYSETTNPTAARSTEFVGSPPFVVYTP